MNQTEIKAFLDEKAEQFNRPVFIETDPIQVPKLFIQKENIEIPYPHLSLYTGEATRPFPVEMKK